MIQILLLCLILVMTPGCGRKEQPKDRPNENQEEGVVVHLKKESQTMVGFNLVKVKKVILQDSIEVVGEMAQETEHVVHVTPPESGRLKSYSASLGQVVDEGTPLCLMETKSGQEIEIKSPGHGIILAQYVKEGDAVDTLTAITTVANPDLLRASFNVYEKDLGGIKLGQKVKVHSIAYPTKVFAGEVVFISPSIDEKTRTMKIRVNVKNEEHLLKFGMFVTGEILVPISEEVLTLPHEAIQNIEGKTEIFIPTKDKEDEFLMREVQMGREAQEQVEILSGVTEDEEVVGKGSYYLKSELQKGELEE